MSQAPMPPGSGGDGERPGGCEKPRQFQPYWWDFLAALPTQVRHPLRDALNTKLSLQRRRAGLHHASCALDQHRKNAATYSDSVDAMMDRRGMEYVDPADPAQATAYVERLTTSGLRALSKRKRTEAAIAYADMAIEWVEWGLAHGD